MVDLKNVVDGYMIREAKQNSDMEVDRLLALLGVDEGASKEADEGGVQYFGPAEEMSPQTIRKMLDNEHERKKKSGAAWDKAFEEAIAPHLLDHENFKPSIFHKTLMMLLGKRLKSKDAVTRYIDDLCSHVIQHLDIFIRKAHGSSTKIKKEPYGGMSINSSDPNFTALKAGMGFLGQVVNKDPSQPHAYEIKVSGPDLADTLYRIDTSASLLELKRSHKYKMKTTGSYDKGRLAVLVEGANRGNLPMMVLTDQIPNILVNGTKDYLETEYKKDIGALEYRIKKLEEAVRKIDDELGAAEKAGDEKKIEALESQKSKLLVNLDELSKLGVPEDADFMKEERQESPYREKIHKYPSELTQRGHRHGPNYWIAYHPPEAMSIETDFNEDDVKKVKRTLGQALEEMHGDYKGFPYKKLAEFLMDSAYAVRDPAAVKSGWKALFIKKIQDYIEKNNLKISFGKNDVDPVIKEVQKTLLQDEKFKNLKQNLIQYKTRKSLRHAADNSVLKRTFDSIWEHTENLADLALEYKMLDGQKRNREIPVPLYREVVEEGTVKNFRGYIEAGHKLGDALDILIAIAEVVGDQDPMVLRMKKLLLTEAWHLDEPTELKEKISIYNKYVEHFPIQKDDRLRIERDRLYNDVKKMIEENISEVPAEKEEKKKKTRRQKVKDLETVVENKPIESIMKERDPEMLKQLEDLFA